ncbi:PQQ-dependent sugar dehydrogenase [Erythrobacter sp. SCSIO 43205]|uniref:PQQ-dependent sugar dehydrogenase n=1 Tax=Erythrobacter sp. SCSIO 43205 TaxID=2779361 RepID=UPI001CAA064D|nr:PQQ-dependent sugar dehydrogenase [Erythrobacter sp. SCSIO 43205]UAB79700.1 PQQ-dependent sugar dehydrogenase [Erythrobacter sp. SCSIO 43205]
MNTFTKLSALSSLPFLALASCATAETGESTETSASAPLNELTITQMGEFDTPWAIEFAPGTNMLFVTEKEGVLKVMDTASGTSATVAGAPDVAFGGQGGLGDIAFLPSEAGASIDGRTVYLSWAEFGEDGETRGAAVGKGTLACPSMDNCALEGLEVIWRQTPKVEGRGHYSHRITFSPDENHMYIASGDRQKLTPAQDTSNTLGSIVRLNLDGTPADGNPFADEGGVTAEIWSYGHRNILGMDWDAQGRLWDVEHGPAGGDELNLVERGANYGWPERSNGKHYDGDPITDHSPDDGFEKPAIWWTPVIAPGDMQFYSGDMFADWQGDALITGLKTRALIRVEIDGENASEAARYPIDGRVRSIDVAPDGSIWLATDEGKVLRLSM